MKRIFLMCMFLTTHKQNAFSQVERVIRNFIESEAVAPTDSSLLFEANKADSVVGSIEQYRKGKNEEERAEAYQLLAVINQNTKDTILKKSVLKS